MIQAMIWAIAIVATIVGVGLYAYSRFYLEGWIRLRLVAGLLLGAVVVLMMLSASLDRLGG